LKKFGRVELLDVMNLLPTTGQFLWATFRAKSDGREGRRHSPVAPGTRDTAH
jgi:hypothetical protein